MRAGAFTYVNGYGYKLATPLTIYVVTQRDSPVSITLRGSHIGLGTSPAYGR
jgi:hypothetical protein